MCNYCHKFIASKYIYLQNVPCTNKNCMGSLMGTSTFSRPPGTCRPKEEVILHAKDFFEQYFTSIKRYTFVFTLYAIIKKKEKKKDTKGVINNP